VDEVWVASEFGRACLDQVSPVPVVKMPLPVVAPDPPTVGRAHFGLPERAFIFLFMFDVSSQTERKNPRAVVRAFRQADLAHEQAVLVLKYSNTAYDPEAVRLLREEAEGLNVVLLDGYMERTELAALLSVADCYVSLHRAEGFGLTMAEAMRLGKPVIATAYSGNMDFMTPDTAYLVDHRIVPIVRDYGPYLRGFVWADPDVEHAARLMRDVVENRDEAARRGSLAAAHIAAGWHPGVTGEAVRRRLEAIRSGHLRDGGADTGGRRA
jgi:glycosyltransferase involved in cell wall biosynthesis